MSEVDKNKTPHIALSHLELQGGAANKRNVSLLMKSDVDITPEIAELLEKVTGEKFEATVVDKEPEVIEKSVEQQEKQKEEIMELEIQKAVESKTAELLEELEKANQRVVELEKAAQEKVEALRKQSIAELVKDEQEAEELFKAIGALGEDAFQTVLKSVQTKVETIEKSDLFERVSDLEDIEKADKEPLHVTILKSKHQQA